MHTEHVDAIIIGAGAVGLASGRALAMKNRHVFVLEAEKQIGSGISSRNSEVIHAGIYYPEASLKAKLCVSGKQKLYAYLQERGIAYNKCGKLIVATDNTQLKMLEQIHNKAIANNVNDLKFLTQKQASALEPELSCVAALLSPSTGVFDSHNYMLSLHGDITNHGGDVIMSTTVESVEIDRDGLKVRINCDGEIMHVVAKTVINAAGLNAVKVAHKIKELSKQTIPSLHFAKGNYFSLSGRNPFSHLIYPVPEEAGLGVHLTIDLMNRARFGPDVEWTEELNFHVNPQRAETFYPRIRQFWKNLPDNSLIPDYAGIRPKIKLHTDKNIHSDFCIQTEEQHGIKGLINLYGIESPGLTASLAIADFCTENL